MQYSLLFSACLACMLCSCHTKNITGKKTVTENLNDMQGVIETAWYEKSAVDTLAPIKNLKNEFIILVHHRVKATNFISFTENYYRGQSRKLDTSLFSLLNPEDWNNLPVNKKSERITRDMLSYRQQADALHTKNNYG